jgi:phosphoribosylaminoimidazole-succinocarboxamide synthase
MSAEMKANVLSQSDLPGVKLLHQGKVRDIYDLGDSLLLVTTDRLSAFDVLLPDPIPHKGRVLNQMSIFWFEQTADLCPNHLLARQIKDFPAELHQFAEQLEGRSVVVKKCQPLPIEAIVRGYLSGSGWQDYQRRGEICGHKLPTGLQESQKLPQPIFTPSTKAALGQHDENISREQLKRLLGAELAAKVEALALAIYRRGAEIAARAGIIIADTKLEFGLYNGELTLIDEVMTPDSSRFWPASGYALGRAQNSFDKQFVRDYLESVNFAKKPPAPALPEDIIAQTSQLYIAALQSLTRV